MLGKIFYIVTIVSAISILVAVFWLPTPYYKLQKKILKKITPRDDLDYSRLIINSFITGFSVWSIMYLLFSLLENV